VTHVTRVTQVESLVESLKGQWGFRSVDVRCQWSCEYLAVLLGCLQAALDHHASSALAVESFEGIDLLIAEVSSS
jgi:hypothetical protein